VHFYLRTAREEHNIANKNATKEELVKTEEDVDASSQIIDDASTVKTTLDHIEEITVWLIVCY